MTFEEFCKIIRECVANGEIKINSELTELDLAIQYTIGRKIKEMRGKEENYVVSPEEIFDLIGEYCGEDTLKRLFPDED